ncbi:thymidylate kinase [Clostridia bacterium]|nr:thymidylate kinase [Clostridia bacterium]
MLVVLDGIDGTGKSTQFELIGEKLAQRGIEHKAISFPDYNDPSSIFVKMYLNGEIEANAYAASSFYAIDRYVSYKNHWESYFKKGTLIIASRYTTSNLIHQLPRLPKGEWDAYIKWAEEFEYKKIGLPRPDLVIYLSMPLNISWDLIEKRGEKRDIHENKDFLTKCKEAGDYVAKKQKWQTISCGEENEIYDIECINDAIFHSIEAVIC